MKIQFNHKYLTVFESSLYRTTSSLIALGDALLIVDPNWLPSEISYIQQYIEYHYQGMRKYLLFTHSDYDHIIGWKAFPDAVVIASAAFNKNPDREKILKQIRNFDYEFYINRNYPIEYPSVDVVIDSAQNKMSINGFSLCFYEAHGHVADGLFLLIPELGLWIAGDYLSNIEIPMIDHDIEAYQHTLSLADKLNQNHNVNVLITGHGDVALKNKTIKERIRNDREYLRLLKNSCPYSEVKQFIYNNYCKNPALLKIHRNNIRKI